MTSKSAVYQVVPWSGTIVYMNTERRPRIPAELADKIDTLREDIPFERYVAAVLERHAAHHLRVDSEEGDAAYLRERHGERRHTYEDPDGVLVYVDKDIGEGHTHSDVEAMIVISPEDFDAAGAYLTEAGLRGLRDVCTELLGEYEG